MRFLSALVRILFTSKFWVATMEKMLLATKQHEKLFEGGEGSYDSWSGTSLPMLSEANVSGGRLVLQPRGFAIPHYSDSSKIGFVFEGNRGVAGIVYPNTSQEEVVHLQKGDAIFIPAGCLSWWFNDSTASSTLSIIFLGETHNAHVPGKISYCFLSGSLGLLHGFQTKLLSQALNLTNKDAEKLTQSQTGALIVRLGEGQRVSKPCNEATKALCFNMYNALPDVLVPRGGGSVTTFTKDRFPVLDHLREGGVDLSASYLRLEANASYGPVCSVNNSSVQISYVVNGSGLVQIVGANGKLALDARLEAGDVFLVPKLNVISILAYGDGMECFSVMTSSQTDVVHLVGKDSVWNALSPEVQQASLNVDPDFQELFISKMKTTSIISPP